MTYFVAYFFLNSKLDKLCGQRKLVRLVGCWLRPCGWWYCLIVMRLLNKWPDNGASCQQPGHDSGDLCNSTHDIGRDVGSLLLIIQGEVSSSNIRLLKQVGDTNIWRKQGWKLINTTIYSIFASDDMYNNVTIQIRNLTYLIPNISIQTFGSFVASATSEILYFKIPVINNIVYLLSERNLLHIHHYIIGHWRKEATFAFFVSFPHLLTDCWWIDLDLVPVEPNFKLVEASSLLKQSTSHSKEIATTSEHLSPLLSSAGFSGYIPSKIIWLESHLDLSVHVIRDYDVIP